MQLMQPGPQSRAPEAPAGREKEWICILEAKPCVSVGKHSGCVSLWDTVTFGHEELGSCLGSQGWTIYSPRTTLTAG